MAERVVAAVTYRDTARGPEFLLVHTKSGPWWTFPKGHVEDDDASPAAAALREAREEAGVVGTVVNDEPFTRYRYLKSRSGKPQDVDAYLVKAKRMTASGEPEREPAWLSAAAARTRFSKGHNAAEHRRVLAEALRRLTRSRRSSA